MAREKTEKRSDGWWLHMPPYIEIGPYSTQEDALDDARGIRRWEREQGLHNEQREMFEGRTSCESGQLDLF